MNALGAIIMKIKLAYPSYRKLMPYCKMFLDSYFPFIKIVKVLLSIYILACVIFYSYLKDIIDIPNITILICLIILFLKNYIYAIAVYFKFKNKEIYIDLNNNILINNAKRTKINRKKSIIVNESELILVFNDEKLSFLKGGLLITSDFCNKEDFSKLINYINIDIKK